MAGGHVGALTRSRNPEHDLRREASQRIEALGVPKDALRAAVCRGEHTPLTSCYYLLMDSLGIRERPNEPAPQEVEAKAAPPAYPQKAGKENAAPDVMVIDHGAPPTKPAVDAEADKPPALVV